MQDGLSTRDAQESLPAPRSRLRVLGRAVVVVGLVAFGVFSLMLTMGAASFIQGCESLVCGQLHQAIFAAVAALAVFVAAYRIVTGHGSAATIVFVGTLPILVVHVVLVVTDPNEAMFFPLSSAPLPAISGAVLLYRAVGRSRPSGSRAPADRHRQAHSEQ